MTEQPSRRTFLGRTITRRAVLGGAPVVGVAALAACSASESAEPRVPAPPGETDQPYRPPQPPPARPEEIRFFSDHEALTVRAMAARLIPGTESDPGAEQAGVIYYIDSKLHQYEDHAEPTFTRGPYALPYTGTAPPPAPEGWVPVPESELYRYGFQSPLTPQQLYRQGIAALDRYSRERFDAAFADLTDEQQDQLLVALDASGQRTENVPEEAQGSDAGAGQEEGSGDEVAGDTEGAVPPEVTNRLEEVFGEVTPASFFGTVRTDTIAGMFSDPSYGGNRNMVGWRLIGYPGAQRSYSPDEMMNGTVKEPQPMHQLPAMNPDRAGGGRPALEQHEKVQVE